MKLNKLNLQGKGELLNEFELKNIKGGYYTVSSCYSYHDHPPTGTNENLKCGGYCDHRGGTCQRQKISGTNWCVCE